MRPLRQQAPFALFKAGHPTQMEETTSKAAKARSEQEDLANRVAELESKLAALSARDIPKSPTSAPGSS